MRPPESWRTARATLAIAAATALAFVLVHTVGVDARAASWAGFLPYRYWFDGYAPGAAPFWLTPLTATLVHGGWFHLIFNLLMLVFCGRAVEGVLGPASIVILYLLGAYGAALSQFAMDPHSGAAMIGASGAASAVLGAYAILFGRNKVKVRNAALALWLNALWLLAGWIALQIVIGLVTRQADLNIAIGAHIGGFAVGMALARPLLLFRYRRA
jgi:membrane associated rhomboid family serine protease